MDNQEYEKQIEELKRRVDLLQRTNLELVNRNLQLGQQIDAYYDVRRRIQMLKDLVIRHKELMRQADLRDDDELMALMEARLEEDFPHENPDFGLKELAEFLGTSQTRLIDLFRRSPIRLSTRLQPTIWTTCDCSVRCITCKANPSGALQHVPRKQDSPLSAPTTASSRMPSA